MGVTEWLVNQVLDSVPNSARATDKAIIRYQSEAGTALPLSGALSG